MDVDDHHVDNLTLPNVVLDMCCRHEKGRCDSRPISVEDEPSKVTSHACVDRHGRGRRGKDADDHCYLELRPVRMPKA